MRSSRTTYEPAHESIFQRNMRKKLMAGLLVMQKIAIFFPTKKPFFLDVDAEKVFLLKVETRQKIKFFFSRKNCVKQKNLPPANKKITIW